MLKTERVCAIAVVGIFRIVSALYVPCLKDPPPVENADVQNRTASHAYYKCRENFYKTVLERIKCVDGRWVGQLPICKDSRCYVDQLHFPGLVLPPTKFLISGTNFPISCKRGYRKISRMKAIRCTFGAWYINQNPCDIVTCLDDPPSIPNGKLSFFARENDTSPVYECNEHFQLIKNSTVRCESGKWVGEPPFCRGTICYIDQLNFPGLLTPPTKYLRSGFSFLSYCKKGYRQISGAEIIKCTSGKWDIVRNPCERVACLDDPPPITNGRISNFAREKDTSVAYECNEYFQLIQNSTVRCESGKWVGEPPFCRETGCDVNQLNFPGLLTPPTKFLRSGNSFEIYCKTGYKNISEKKAIKCILGKWDIVRNPCDIGTCIDDPPPIVNGKPSSFAREHHSAVFYECDKNFRLIRNSTVRCESGRWMGEPPLCEEKTCVDDPPLVNNGKLYPFTRKQGAVIQYECDENFDMIGKSTVRCEAGKWIGYPPLCRRETCVDDPPLVNNGKLYPFARNHGSVVQYECDGDFDMIGESTVRCEAGKWIGRPPLCRKDSVDSCPDPPIPIGSFVSYFPPSRSSDVYHSGNLRLRTGLRAGLAAPVPLNTPERVSVSTSAGFHRPGTRAMFACESVYYQLIGPRTRRCLKTGRWSGRSPICIPVCGRSNSPRSPVIVNGNATDIGQWPWQAGIGRYVENYERWLLVCGASLLNEQWVITAAHCVTYPGTTQTIAPDNFQAYLGKYHREDSKDDHYVQIRKVQEIHVHPDYNPTLFDSDISLILLDSPVQLNHRVQPICLPTEQTTRENLVNGKSGVVTGWGMNENKTYSETLQQAVLPVVSQANCERGYGSSGISLRVTNNMFCAGYAEGRIDTCSGDSGGPMVFIDDSSKEKTWVLEGIVSWGSPRGCGNANQYGGFVTVSRFLDWIHFYI